jgi:hypothetical protein
MAHNDAPRDLQPSPYNRLSDPLKPFASAAIVPFRIIALSNDRHSTHTSG